MYFNKYMHQKYLDSQYDITFNSANYNKIGVSHTAFQRNSILQNVVVKTPLQSEHILMTAVVFLVTKHGIDSHFFAVGWSSTM